MASIRRLPSGSWCVQVRRKGLKSITRTFKTKTNAKEFAKQVENDSEIARKLGTPVAKSLSFHELVKLYRAQYTGRDPSIDGRLSFWKKQLGDVLVTSIDEFTVDEGLIELAKTRTGSTVNRYKSNLSAVFIFFIRHPDYKRLRFQNPVRRESVSVFKENPPKDRFLDQAEQKTLLSACRRSSWDRMYLAVLLSLTTGARKSEVMGLCWSDIDLSARTATLGTTKSGRPRLLPLTQPVVEEMMRFRGKSGALVFRSPTKPDKPFEFAKQWRNALIESGIDHCRWHDLRHSAASNLVRAGRSLFEVGTLLGHSSTQMTARYSHLAIHDTRIMLDRVVGDLR